LSGGRQTKTWSCKNLYTLKPLAALRDRYLYDDWEEIQRSVERGRCILQEGSEGDEEVDLALRRWASLLSQGALFKETGRISWRVPPHPTPFPSRDGIQELQRLGPLVDRLLKAAEEAILESGAMRKLLGFPACPEEEELLHAQAGQPLLFLRLDLVPASDGSYRLLEVQVVAGGLGITQALRETYGPHPDLPGVAPLYEEAVIAAYKSRQKGRIRPAEGRIPVAVLGKKASPYRHDHLILARYLQWLDMTIAPLVALEPRPDGRYELPGLGFPPVIHRLFRSPMVFRHSPRRACWLKEQVTAGTLLVVNPWKDVMEDKRILALVHEPEASDLIGQRLQKGDLEALRRWIPETRLATQERIADLIDLPRSRRPFYLKKGRSFESRQLCDGQQVSLRQWKAACLRAKAEGDWILQEAVRGAPLGFRYLDLAGPTIREMKGYLRISPYYFRSAYGELRLGDILVTARPERSRVHGATDAILVVPGFHKGGCPKMDSTALSS